MYKKCDEHGKFKGFVEKDVEFYKKTMNIKGETCPTNLVVIPITHKCNLNCRFCYVPNRKLKDKSLNEIKKDIKNIISNVSTGLISLSGGESTLRKDLFELIKFIKKKYPRLFITLLTNGLKLSDLRYVRKLKESGIDSIMFSFNGFNNKIYQKIENANLLDIKMKALENIKKEKIATIISQTLVRGINEKDLKHIIDFALNNLDFIEEVRIRGAARVGRHDEVKPLTTSEMLELVGKSFGKDKNYFLKTFSGRDCYHSSYNFHMQLYIDCGKNKRIIDWHYGDTYKKPTIKNIIKTMNIILKILFRRKLNEIIKAIIKSRILTVNPYKNYKIFMRRRKIFWNLLNIGLLRIKIWYWADKDNLDLNEISAWGIMHTTADGRILPFSEAVIRANEL